MAVDTKKDILRVLQRSFLNKDQDAMKADLLQFARIFFPDRIRDFSEAGVGGMFLDFSSFVGDTMSFYLDHQFNELDPENAVESVNIKRHLQTAGVPIVGASPAVVSLPWALRVPADPATLQPQTSALPIILQGSVAQSDDGINFELTEDLDFSSTNADGSLKAVIIADSFNTDGSPNTFILKMGGPGNSPNAPDGICISGFRTTETFVIPNAFVPFREITLGSENATQVISITDSDGNQYYQVDALVQDTVFRSVPNIDVDGNVVADTLEIIPAPFRYTANMDFDTKLTTIRFGAGNAATLLDDIIADPSELALPLYGKNTFSRFALDPGQLLNTQTLGASPVNTTLTVAYRYGGGLSHNSVPKSINNPTVLRMSFPGNPSAALATQVRASVSVQNSEPARGGEDAPTLDELRSRIPAARNAQSRIVSKPDLLARIYTMPSNFGRVFRAGIRSNPRNPLATQLFIISRDQAGNLTLSPDTLKKNLRTFLNSFRMITDAIDILDSPVINIAVQFKVATDPNDSNKNLILQDITSRLKLYFDIKNFQIDQPIIIDDVQNIIYNNPGVVSVADLKFKGMSGVISDRQYSDVSFDVSTNTKKKMLVGPPGSIFEMKYPDFDIIGSAI